MPESALQLRLALRQRVTCPHCWDDFAAEDTLWISQHPELAGEDPRLGGEQQLRFLPTRFSASGNAIDLKGAACQDLACPKCHLAIPRALFELRRFFISITGEQASGKSYFLASMAWQLRRTLPQYFSLLFADSDPQSNDILNRYEEINFLNPDRDEIVKLEKTQETGYMYNEVRYGEQFVRYPRPFFFTLSPRDGHPSADGSGKVSRVMVLYDNAGESFRPGADVASAPVTRHLTRSNGMLFLFDPSQDPRFRDACSGKTDDPQFTVAPVTNNQELIFNEVASRMRRHTDLGQDERMRRPLIVIVTKYDAWSPLLNEDLSSLPLIPSNREHWNALDLQRVETVSRKLRGLLWDLCPGLVSAAEGLANSVTFVPVSATGVSPELDEKGIIVGVRPRNITPMWVEVPILLALCKVTHGLVPHTTRSQNPQRRGDTMNSSIADGQSLIENEA